MLSVLALYVAKHSCIQGHRVTGFLVQQVLRLYVVETSVKLL